MNNHSKPSLDNAPQADPVSDTGSKWIASAPGRINLIGEHTDYNHGYALPMAINRYTTIAAERASNNEFLTFESSLYPGRVLYSLDGSTCQSDNETLVWSRYLAGVVNELTRVGIEIPSSRFCIQSDVPAGAGLSSSASLEVAMAMLVQKIANRCLTPIETALLCQSAEHRHVGVLCGLMDQLASVSGIAGHVMLMDCRSNSIEQISFPEELAVIVINSQVKHRLVDGGYRQRREECQTACHMLAIDSLRDVTRGALEQQRSNMPDTVFRRARHVVSENNRTVEAASRLSEGQWNSVGELMYLSHESMRDDFEISTPEIDLLVEIARSLGSMQGVFGSRMTGGGFGGCTITLTAAHRAECILHNILERYWQKTGTSINGFITYPANGAFVVNRMT